MTIRIGSLMQARSRPASYPRPTGWPARRRPPPDAADPSKAVPFHDRRPPDSRFSLNLTGRDLLNSFRITSTYETPLFRDRSGQHLKLRSVLIGLTYNLGSTPRRQPEQFDFTTLPTAGS